ncbi:MAG: pyridoxine 5'-phosphate synthase [Ignavibacteriae bacterium]|nr:pyridoxine 5'-phosphate synthase [Ignavibacteriota bacterium]
MREDRRHIRDRDVELLCKSITTKLDLEMAATQEIVDIALRLKPDLVTLVPERRRELTTEGGLDVVRLRRSLAGTIKRFHTKGIPVSLFVDPRREQIEASREIDSDMIELHTGEYAIARTGRTKQQHLRSIRAMAAFGTSIGLGVNAGHGLDYTNVPAIAAINDIAEISIGHAIIARALFVGLENAVREMARLVKTR